MRSPESGGFLGISLLIGVVVGVGAAGLVYSMELIGVLREQAVDVVGGHHWTYLATVPVGILVAWWVAGRFAPEVEGDGVPEVAAALAVRGGYLSTRSIPLKILTTALTVGSGGSAGREGPIVQIGGAIGSSIARHSGLGEDKVRSLLAAGAAAGLGASFNAPIAGMLFALEVILGSFAVKHMSAVVLASVAAAVTLRSIVPQEEILRAAPYTLGHPAELVLYMGLALVVVVAGFMFLRLLDMCENFVRRRVRVGWMRPVGFGVIVGAIVLWEPRLLGTGQEVMGSLLTLQDLGEQFDVTLLTVRVLALLTLGKIVATSFTIAGGGSGGTFLPSMFIGTTAGVGFAQLVAPYWTISQIKPGAFAVVGMATMIAVVARAPLTAILIVFEVTGARDYGLVLPLMLSATLAGFVADRVHPESVYTMALARRGIKLVRAGEVDILDTVTVGEVMFDMGVSFHPATTVAQAADLMARRHSHGIPVIDEGRLAGIITISDVERARPEDTVGSAMTARPVTVVPSTPVSEALARMAGLGVGRLPVVAEDDPGRLVGMFRREEAVKAYHRALGASTDQALARERLQLRTDSGAHFYDFRVPAGSIADGKLVREVVWPQGSTIVSIRRGTAVIVPQGATRLHRDDVVTAFGTDESRTAMVERMNAGADEPTAELILDEG